MTTLKGPAIFLAQFMGDEPPFNDLKTICRWRKASGLSLCKFPHGMHAVSICKKRRKAKHTRMN